MTYSTALWAAVRSVPWGGARLGGAFLATAIASAVLAAAAGVAWGDAVPAHGRAWELITPPDPNAAPVVTVFATVADGNRVAWATLGPAPGAAAGGVLSPAQAERRPSGWVGRAADHAYSVTGLPLFIFPLPFGAGKDFSTWIWRSPMALLPGAPTNLDSGIYRSGTTAPLTLLGSAGDTSSFAGVGVSDDAQRAVFQSSSQLLPAAAGVSGPQVYEYAGSSLRLVGVDGAGAPLSACGTIAGSDSRSPNPVSSDGKRIFVTSPPFGCGASGSSRVHLREDGATTTEISASQCTRPDCDSSQPGAWFMGATPDGATAFLASGMQLTNDDLDTTQDLYSYDVASGDLTRISVGAPGVAANVIATRAYPSADGSRVYFLARGALVPGQGTIGSPNLYVADGGGVRFVATLLANDYWPAGDTRSAALEEVEITPEGGRLLFTTTAAVTSDDGDLKQDVYLYDADADSLVRASGPVGGGNGAFDAEASRSDENIDIQAFVSHPIRSLSDDGRRLFFTTREALVPEDVNDDVDVYEWFDGSVGLISAGAPSVSSIYYGGASADGRTVFFAAADSLVSADDDRGDYDLYAARVGGGFPESEAPQSDCVSCPPPPVERPLRSVPASVTHVGSDRRRLGVRRAGRAALRRMAERGVVTLIVRAPLPGRVVATARVRIGDRARTVARGRARAARAGELSLGLRLSKQARRRLSERGALDVHITIRHSRLDRATAVLLKLRTR